MRLDLVISFVCGVVLMVIVENRADVAAPPVFEWVIVENRAEQVCEVQYRVSFSHRACYDCGDGVMGDGPMVPHRCWCLVGDLNCDGVVDLRDYAIMQRAFGGGG